MKLLFALLATLFLSTAWAAEHPPVPPGATITGEVLEVLDVDGYTYLRLGTPDGETWAAVDKAAVKKGAKVTIDNVAVMTNFQSRALNRRFDRIVFGSLAGSGTAPPDAAGPAPGPDLGAMHANVAGGAPVGNVKVPKATGPDARTVEEIITGSAKLKNKTVVVRGTVVKFTSGVMGKNWVHLRDGTGSADQDTHDVLVTTQDGARIGDVVVAKGVVNTDVALGAGYTFKVLVENATLQK